MNIQGYYFDMSKSQRRGDYSDPICINCAFTFAVENGFSLRGGWVAPIFDNTEMDCIPMCGLCGDLLEVTLTGDCPDCQYDSVVSVYVMYFSESIAVEVVLYNGDTRIYTKVTPSSYVRLMRYLLPRHKVMPDGTQFFSMTNNGVVYHIRGFVRN